MLLEIHCKTGVDFPVFHSNKHGGYKPLLSSVFEGTDDFIQILYNSKFDLGLSHQN